MSKDLTFAGTNLRTTYGLRISGSGVYDSPVRAYEAIRVPGRSGDILQPEKRMENMTVTYPAFIEQNFDTYFAALRAFLMSKIGYQRIVDGYHPNEFRMGYFQGALLPQMQRNLRAGSFDLSFICKPQRFLAAGETATTFTSSGTYNNPTNFDALPLLKAYKATNANTGTLTIGSVVITITWGTMSSIFIDCDTMNCYYMSGSAKVLANDKVSMNSLYFPVLKPGNNGITPGTGVSKVDITPRTFTV